VDDAADTLFADKIAFENSWKLYQTGADVNVSFLWVKY
jgi:hypothetical protein